MAERWRNSFKVTDPRYFNAINERVRYVDGGYQSGTTYLKNDMILDQGYLAIALVDTNERPAPQPLADPQWTIDETLGTWTTQSPSGTNVVAGNEYNNSTTALYLHGVRIYVPDVTDGIFYRAAISIHVDPDVPEVSFSDWFQPVATGWQEVVAPKQLYPAGIRVNVAIQVDNRNDSLEDVVWYNYTSSNVDAPVAVGEAHRRNNRTYVDFNHVSDSGAPVGEEGPLSTPPVSGTTIVTSVSSWTVTSVINEVDYWRCEIEGSGNPVDGEVRFTFDTPVAQSPQYYVTNTDYWTNWPLPSSDASGFLALSGTEDPTVAVDAFGADILVQPVHLSDDWQLLTLAPSQASGVALKQLTDEEDEWVQVSAYPFSDLFSETTDGQWTEVERVTQSAGMAKSGTAEVVAVRTDIYPNEDRYIGIFSHMAWYDTELHVDNHRISRLGPDQLNFRIRVDGDDTVAEVKGRNNQVWFWSIKYFNREF